MNPYRVWLIQDLIEKNKRVFKIPVYQRNYDWSDVECGKLFADILSAFHNDKKHFTGCIVYIKGDRNYSGLDEDLVIDGQQRITTIFLLLKAMYDIACEQEDSHMQSELRDYLYNRHCEEEYKLKLKPIKADDIQFRLLMSNDFETLHTDSNIYKNYKLFLKLIRRELDRDLLLSDILEGLKKLEIIEIVLDKSQGDDPQTIFESINSTGLDLSLADLVRNYVLMSDAQQDYLFEKYWQKLESVLGSENLNDYIITFLNFKLYDSVAQRNAYNKFKELFTNNNYTNETMLQELLHYGKYHSFFIGKTNPYSCKIDAFIRDFRLIDQSTIYPFLYSVFDDFDRQEISESTLIQVLEFFRSYCVRRIVCEIASNSLRGLFKTLYRRLFAENKENYYEKIYSFFKGLHSKDKLPDDAEFKHKLMSANLYNKKKVCKYLLGTIEDHASHEKMDINALTIEHVLPQKLNDAGWTNALGNAYTDTYNTYLHTLGNLTITGYNSELGARSFQEKKDIIRKYSRAITLNADILSEDRWTEEAIVKRAKVLAEIATGIFHYPAPAFDIVSLVDEEKLSFDDTDMVTGKKPSSISICGEVFPVSSFAEMLQKTFEIFASLDVKVLEKLADAKFRIPYADRVYITYDETLLRKGTEVGNSGIFYETNLSAKTILQFIKELFEQYKLDKDDFYFTIV